MTRSRLLAFSLSLLLTLGGLSLISLLYNVKTRNAPITFSEKATQQNLKEPLDTPKEKETRANLKLALKLGLQVRWTTHEVFQECYWSTPSNYKYTECILISFIKRAQKNPELMEALRLAKEARVEVKIYDDFLTSPDQILINAGANDQAIIDYIKSNPRIVDAVAGRLGFKCVNPKYPKLCTSFFERLQKNESLKGVVANARERGVYIILDDSFRKFPNSLFIDPRASDEKIIEYIKTH